MRKLTWQFRDEEVTGVIYCDEHKKFALCASRGPAILVLVGIRNCFKIEIRFVIIYISETCSIYNNYYIIFLLLWLVLVLRCEFKNHRFKFKYQLEMYVCNDFCVNMAPIGRSITTAP